VIQRLLRFDGRAFVALLNVIATVLAVTMLPFAAGIGLGNNLDIPILFLLAGLLVGLFAELAGGDSGDSSGRASIQLRNLILLTVSVGAVAILSGSFGLDQIADRQAGTWNIVLQPLGFVVYGYSAFNVVTRLGCPVLESDAQTEHRSSLFCRHLRGIIVAYLASLIFLGGWNPLPAEGGLGRSLLSCLILHLKVLLIYTALMWMRFERDRITTSGLWQSLNKSVISVVIFNCVMTTVVMLLGDTNKWLILAGTQWTTLVALVAVAFMRQTASAKQ
jgi:NADH-quinone oxidoreductase subunit H